jgi:hypothetical protein
VRPRLGRLARRPIESKQSVSELQASSEIKIKRNKKGTLRKLHNTPRYLPRRSSNPLLTLS